MEEWSEVGRGKEQVKEISSCVSLGLGPMPVALLISFQMESKARALLHVTFLPNHSL